jgi:hypothetical protein
MGCPARACLARAERVVHFARMSQKCAIAGWAGLALMLGGCSAESDDAERAAPVSPFLPELAAATPQDRAQFIERAAVEFTDRAAVR